MGKATKARWIREGLSFFFAVIATIVVVIVVTRERDVVLPVPAVVVECFGVSRALPVTF